MTERIRYWKCQDCFGTGRRISGGFGKSKFAYECASCDGTGNGMVHGATERHKRALAEIDQENFNPKMVPST